MKHLRPKRPLHPLEPNLFCFAAMAYAARRLETIRADAKAPEERPPNHDAVAKPCELAPPGQFPWNEWLRLARLGDETAKLRFCNQAESFIKQFCNVPLFSEWLGKDEVRGIAALATVEFLMEYDAPPEDRNIPFMLKRIIRNKLTDQLRKQYVRGHREHSGSSRRKQNNGEQAPNIMETLATSQKEEPEMKVLDKEMNRMTREAFRRLKPCEQTVLRAFFYQKKTPAAIAEELHCSRQYVEKVRGNALRRMRKLLDEKAA